MKNWAKESPERIWGPNWGREEKGVRSQDPAETVDGGANRSTEKAGRVPEKDQWNFRNVGDESGEKKNWDGRKRQDEVRIDENQEWNQKAGGGIEMSGERTEDQRKPRKPWLTVKEDCMNGCREVKKSWGKTKFVWGKEMNGEWAAAGTCNGEAETDWRSSVKERMKTWVLKAVNLG